MMPDDLAAARGIFFWAFASVVLLGALLLVFI